MLLHIRMHLLQKRGGQPAAHPLQQKKIHALQSLSRFCIPFCIICDPPAEIISLHFSIILQSVQHLLHDTETTDHICHKNNLAHNLLLTC